MNTRLYCYIKCPINWKKIGQQVFFNFLATVDIDYFDLENKVVINNDQDDSFKNCSNENIEI